MAFCDIISTLVIAPELVYINYEDWIFHQKLCSYYLGLNFIAKTASTYFVIAIGMHAISTYNLIIKLQTKKKKNSIENDDKDNRYETTINNKLRLLIIDYSKKKTNVAVFLPILLIWFLAVSISIPLFVFGEVFYNKEDQRKFCGINNVNQYNNLIMESFLIIIKIIIPILCLTMIMLSIGFKLYHIKNLTLHQRKSQENLSFILKLSFVLIMSHIIFTMQYFCGSLFLNINYNELSFVLFFKIVDNVESRNIIAGLILFMISNFLFIVRPIIFVTYMKDSKTKCKIKNQIL